MKTYLALFLAALCISGCSKPSEPVVTNAIKDDWGVVQKMVFVRAGSNSAYFHVVTNKLQFAEIDITDFPDGKINVGDSIYRQSVLSGDRAEVSYCKGMVCKAHSTCYSWQPCFSSYQSESNS